MSKDFPTLRRIGCLWALLVPAALWGVGSLGATAALSSDAVSAGTTMRAADAGPPSVLLGAVDLGTLHAGSLCEDTPVAAVRNGTAWSQHLSVEATGWLTGSDVYVSPAVIGPGESATIYFTRAEVGPPQAIAGEIRLTASPGSFTRVITVSGQVVNPEGAAAESISLPVGCRTAPRAEGGAEELGPDSVEGEQPQAPEPPVEEPQTPAEESEAPVEESGTSEEELLAFGDEPADAVGEALPSDEPSQDPAEEQPSSEGPSNGAEPGTDDGGPPAEDASPSTEEGAPAPDEGSESTGGAPEAEEAVDEPPAGEPAAEIPDASGEGEQE